MNPPALAQATSLTSPVRSHRIQQPLLSPTGTYTVPQERLLVLSCLLLYVTLAVLLANVRPPQSDEGHFAEAAAQIVISGRFITPTWTEWLPTLNQHVYAVMPLYFLSLAAWFKAFGIGMLSMRYFSVFWGTILVFAYFVLVRSISQNRRLASLALLLLVFNYDVINLTTARYDGMAAALSVSGLAIYAILREGHLPLALLSANTFIAAAAMTHPYGAFGLGNLIILFLILDRHRFRTIYCVLVAAPYLIALSAWGLYISQDLPSFKAQFLSNATVHKTSLVHPLLLVYGELHDRYWVLFAGMRAGIPVYMKLKIGLLVLYLVSFIASALTPEIRNSRSQIALWGCAAFSFFALMLGDGTRLYVYLVHVISLYSIIVAIWLNYLSRSSARQRALVAMIVCGIGIFTLASIAYRVRLNSYGRAYLPAANYVSAHVVERQLVFAGGEFVLPISFDRHLLDDVRLGYSSHKRADYIVVGNDYDANFQQQKTRSPFIYNHVTQTLRTYRLAFESRAGLDYYRVYVRSDLNEVADSVKARATAPH
jgi:4-amino-4-deoxy-L-arabinose transferase-like glycosyltransferase